MQRTGHFFREQTLKVINLLVGNGSSIAMEFDKSDHSRGSQHCCPCRTWLQSDKHVSGKERHRNNFLAIAPAMALFEHREECLDTFILQLRRRFPLEPVSSLDGVASPRETAEPDDWG